MRIQLLCICLFCSVPAHIHAFSLESIAKAFCMTTGGYVIARGYSWYVYQDAVSTFSVPASLAQNKDLRALKAHILAQHHQYCKSYSFITPPYAHYPFLRYKTELDSAIIWLRFAQFFYLMTEYTESINNVIDRLYLLRETITQFYEYMHEQRDYEMHTTLEDIKGKVNQYESHS